MHLASVASFSSLAWVRDRPESAQALGEGVAAAPLSLPSPRAVATAVARPGAPLVSGGLGEGVGVGVRVKAPAS